MEQVEKKFKNKMWGSVYEHVLNRWAKKKERVNKMNNKNTGNYKLCEKTKITVVLAEKGDKTKLEKFLNGNQKEGDQKRNDGWILHITPRKLQNGRRGSRTACKLEITNSGDKNSNREKHFHPPPNSRIFFTSFY